MFQNGAVTGTAASPANSHRAPTSKASDGISVPSGHEPDERAAQDELFREGGNGS